MKIENPKEIRSEDYKALEGLYQISETIGRGGFAKVKKATHVVTGERVAIKILDKVSLGDDLPRVHREISTLKVLDHPHVCKLYQVIETDKKIFMVMEYCRGGELFDYIVQRDRLNEDEARRIFRQIASAVSYIHMKGIAHRDLKPENILLDDENNVKLIDFGLCASPKNGLRCELDTCCGSPAYAAPELVKGEKYIGSQADIWSLGVLLYALLNGCLPFDDQNLGVLYRKILGGDYNEPKWLSEGSKHILRCMLTVNPKYRLSIDELLQHTWCNVGKPEPLPITTDDDLENRALDQDALRIIANYKRLSMASMQSRLAPFRYESYDLATYFILLERKKLVGVRLFRDMKIRVDGPAMKNRCPIQKSLESEFSECETDTESIDSVPHTNSKPHHVSLEGGLDNSYLLSLGSPKVEVKENDVATTAVDNTDFLRPKTPVTSKRSYLAPDNGNALSPAKSAESVLTDYKTPSKEKRTRSTNHQSPAEFASPAKKKVLGSLERGLDKVRLLLTPRSTKSKKPKTIRYAGKGAFNVSATGSSNPDVVIKELTRSLHSIGIDCIQKGYRLVSKYGDSVKFELEIVSIDSLKLIGIRRKRVSGDAWAYKKIIEQVLSLTGACQLQSKLPLQTMV